MINSDSSSGPIGVFDSGYGGLTVLKELVRKLPQYDYLYLGDNARAPYGSRSFDSVYEYTLECVKKLFENGCHLVILACNTASAKALRTIQQKDLPLIDPNRRVLGVIRPTTEIAGNFSKTKHIGILATPGTVTSGSYVVELHKFFPDAKIFQEACPMWVPLVENNEFQNEGADYFIEKHLNNLLTQSGDIDTIVLGCTHYPLLISKIKKHLPSDMTILSQGAIVADSLADYFARHPELESKCGKGATRTFYTTDDTEAFNRNAALFFGKEIKSQHLSL